ncbi:hypothetical protein ABN763_13405 [Spongiivirga sp. MCCC 1A20706]|uniref:hypothetical protein n=1 Tax=Spongiivirga sp. MCCC 1A20706 TaxID=3160963 RepID=UPI003977996F
MMKTLLYLLLTCCSIQITLAQWTTPNSNEVSTTREVIAPVFRLSNEIRIPNTFSPTDPTIGTLDNTGYGINIDKTNGIGFAFNGSHKVFFKTNGSITTKGTTPSIHIEGSGTGNYQGATLMLSAKGATTSNKHISTWLMTHRGTDGTASFEVQRRGNSSEYNGSALLYKDGYGWKFGVASNPTAELTNAMTIKNTGKVGIGTTSPLTNLHVSTGTSGDAIFRLEADTDNDNESDNPLIQLRQDGGALGINMGFSEENFGGNIFGIGTRYTNNETWNTFTINTQNGNVGIGTKTPGAYKLAVNGKIHSKEVKVDLSGWSDFVFEKDYKLPTLTDVENHIQEKGHLQDIPSAKEVAENGIFLGEMDAKLLQKIEELMLYTIQQQKEIEQLKNQVKKLKKNKK